MATISTDEYIKAITHRRTIYGLNDTSPVSNERIVEIVKGVMNTTPSSYNTQPGRIVLLLGAPHKKLWDIVSEIALPLIKTHAGEEMEKAMAGRFAGFKGESRIVDL
jgi:predicted oxidoreductase (fatty acid repression mutant protein)